MNQPEIRILGRSDLASLMTFADYVQAVEDAFTLLASGRIAGAGVMDLPGVEGTFHVKGSAMPFGDGNYVAVKVNGNFPANKDRFGLPTIQGAILVCDAIHGYPLALLDSTEITMSRTGAATAVAARRLAKRNAETATIAGCGTQGRIQLLALVHALPLKRIFAVDRDPDLCREFCTRMQKETGLPVTALNSTEEGTRQSDVIVTCTTSRRCFLMRDDVPAGAFVAAVGADSPEKHEIDPALMASSKVVADILDQCVHMGDLHHAIAARTMTRDDVYAELHEIVSGTKPGRTSEEEITIFDSTGTAIQDAAAGAVAYQRALEQDLGIRVNLMG